MEEYGRYREGIDLFEKGCGALGLEPDDRQIHDFMIYYEYLTEQNKVMNLTGITDFNEVMIKHFLDSLSVVKAIDLKKVSHMIDVGTGAGFPGLPLKIMFPHLKVLLLDSLNKRIRFLNQMIEKLRYQEITAIHGRAEELARDRRYRESFDLCVSRAVTNLSSLSEYCLPFVKVKGIFVSYKSVDIDEEMKNAGKAITILGGEPVQKTDFILPESDLPRSLVVIRKVKITPPAYPRKAGMPTKEPIHG